MYNFNYATKSIMKTFGSLAGTKATHIPVQITETKGEKKSIYFLNKDESVNTGIFITETGKEVYNKTETIKIIDFSKGYGKLTYSTRSGNKNKKKHLGALELYLY